MFTLLFFYSVDFPFLVLLMSGGHCLLAIAQDVENFLLLGESINDAPGEAFDKVSQSSEKQLILRVKSSRNDAINKMMMIKHSTW